MLRINEEPQQPSSITLNEGSMIQQYNELQFSDQKSRSQDGSSYGDQLSEDKLKFLGVDRFPWKIEKSNSGVQKPRKNSHEQSVGQKSNESMFHIQKNSGFYSRKKRNIQKSSSYQCETKDESSFNIDSFLNSQPIQMKVSSRGIKDNEVREQINQYKEKREKYNRNPLAQIIQEKKRDRNNQKYQKSQYFGKKEIKMSEISQFSSQNTKTNQIFLRLGNKVIEENSQPSITLITLPQVEVQGEQEISMSMDVDIEMESDYGAVQNCFCPSGNVSMQNDFEHISKEKNQRQRNISQRNNQQKTYMRKHSMQKHPQQIPLQIRLKQAKLNFYNNFLPESMKIKDNAFNFWKYVNQNKNKGHSFNCMF